MNTLNEKNIPQDTENYKFYSIQALQGYWGPPRPNPNVEIPLEFHPVCLAQELLRQPIVPFPLKQSEGDVVLGRIKIFIFWALFSKNLEALRLAGIFFDELASILKIAEDLAVKSIVWRTGSKTLAKDFRAAILVPQRIYAACAEFCYCPPKVNSGKEAIRRVEEFIENTWRDEQLKAYELLEVDELINHKILTEYKPKNPDAWTSDINIDNLAYQAYKLIQQGYKVNTACKEVAKQALKEKQKEDPDIIYKILEKKNIHIKSNKWAKAVDLLAGCIRQKLLAKKEMFSQLGKPLPLL
ncbi:hypothetical protein A7Q09_02745 [Methylacidiphilum sp. Yel]|uniref:hypothetical protein n=1 Tax=Methylacidiphilum sp. Yel TaxID=1847730 RepID=UPI00106D3160|nr:hypothetical protein [Methylacidiphilum sp. Yel]TFE65507.1 hypothetical protein A7Q09_02745 [Methylacidiphilum sp. Yel]